MRRRRKRKRKKRRRSEARDGSLRRCMRFRETFFFVSTQTDEKSRSNVVGSELSSASVSRRRAGSRSDASPRPHRAAELGEARRQRARRGRRRDRVDVASVPQHGRRVHLDGPDPENGPKARGHPPAAFSKRAGPGAPSPHHPRRELTFARARARLAPLPASLSSTGSNRTARPSEACRPREAR
jgi:hypothetical protein